MPKKSTTKIPEAKIAEILEILDSGEANGNVEKTLAFFHDMPEDERRQYAKPIQKFCRERQNMRSGLTRLDPNETDIVKMRQMAQRASNSFQHWQNIAKVVWRALLATGTPAEIEKYNRQVARFPFFQPPHTENSLFEVLGNRKPEWLEEFLQAQFETSSSDETWKEYRQFYKAGLVSRMISPATILGLFTYYQWTNLGTSREPIRPDIDSLRNDKELLDTEIWLLFDLPLPALRVWAPQASNDRWLDALATLSQEGILDRKRLLDSALNGIARNYLEWQEKFLIDLHDRLAPTPEEQFERLDKYIAILNSSRLPTAHFALERILPFLKSNQVGSSDIETILKSIPPFLLDKSKGRVKKVLSALEMILKNNPATPSQVVPLLLDAIVHENKDIQESAAKILLKHADLKNGEIADSVQRILPMLTPTVRALFPAMSESTQAPSKPPISNAEVSIPKDFSEKYLNLASVSEIQDALKTGSDFLPSTKFNGMDVPRLYPEKRLIPVSSVRNLIDLMLKFLEHPFDFADFERIIDGIARLTENRDEEFERNTGPIRRWFQKNEFHWPWLDVIEAWTEGEISTGLVFDSNSGVYPYWCSLIDRIYRSKVQTGTFQPLSTPTHAGGWIDPIVFVERLSSNIEKLDKYDIYDKISALLRLAPDKRAQALAKLDQSGTMKQGYWNAVHYALGASDVSIDKIEPEWAHAPIWAAASRARNPFADDHFIVSQIPELGSGTALLPIGEILITREIDWSHVPFLPQAYDTTFASPLKPESDQDLYPSILLYKFRHPQGIPYFHLFDLWPGNSIPYHLSVISFLLEGMNSHSYDESKILSLARLNDPDYPWSKEAAMHLAVGLVCSAPGAKTVAVDIAIAMMYDGRFSEAEFVKAVIQLLPFSKKVEIPESLKNHRQLRYGGDIEDYRLVPSRWVKNFVTIAKESPLHAQYVRRVVERIVPDLPDKDVGAFLDLLHELCLESGESVDEEKTRQYLASFKGSGKAAKTGNRLLDLKRNENLSQPHRRQAAERALQGRIERVKRWMAASHES